jgi:hypothetical protein
VSEPQRLTRWQYAEVRALCRQYEELRSQAALLLGARGQSFDPQPHGGGTHGDPVAATADKREHILQTVHLIDRTAQAVDGGRWYKALIHNTCYGVPYDKLDLSTLPTSHRWDFFKARRLFYWLLYHCRHGQTITEAERAWTEWNDFS